MIGDIIAAAAVEMRLQAESMMTAHLQIERIAGTTFDPATNEDTLTWETVYDGPGRMYSPGRSARPELINAGDQQINKQRYYGSIPQGTLGVQAADRVTVTASDDPGQVGKTFTIESVLASNAAIARRFVAVDDQG